MARNATDACNKIVICRLWTSGLTFACRIKETFTPLKSNVHNAICKFIPRVFAKKKYREKLEDHYFE